MVYSLGLSGEEPQGLQENPLNEPRRDQENNPKISKIEDFSQKKYFKLEPSLEKIEQRLDQLESPCTYLPIAIEKALVAKDWSRGNRWGKYYSNDCNPTRGKPLIHYLKILNQVGDKEEFRRISGKLNNTPLSKKLKSQFEKLRSLE